MVAMLCWEETMSVTAATRTSNTPSVGRATAGGRRLDDVMRRPAPRMSTPESSSVRPALLTADDAARLLRTARRAIYAMVEREQLPAPVRIGRRVLLRQDDLSRWLETKQQRSSHAIASRPGLPPD